MAALISLVRTGNQFDQIQNMLGGGELPFSPPNYNEGLDSVEGAAPVCEIDGSDVDGLTAIAWASMKGLQEVVDLLIEKGADVNKTDKMNHTPLHWAAARGDVTVMQLILAAQANVNAINKIGRTPLHFAAVHGHFDAVKVLMEAGADHKIQTQFGETALDLAKDNLCKECVSFLSTLP